MLQAAPVDFGTARLVGKNFANTTFSSSFRSVEPQLVLATESYFVFNVGTQGFVIVSADDTFRPIVGYSDEGVFDTENPSPEMMYYLNSLSQGRQAALSAKAVPDAMTIREWSVLTQGERMPSRNGNRGSFYLVPMRWNQNAPYNKFAPSNSYAGCVATAMSMVMAYWKHPTHGYGSHSYIHYQYGELSADFSAAHYDFDLMPNSISDASPVENIDAVAYFMYHCGIAVDMSYSPSGSGAYSEDVPEAVLKYFDYTSRCRYYMRDNFTLKEFQDILKEQFDLGWPCYYSGQDVNGEGGHAFVCDGYDDNDLFHFNWGWGGSGNGFFVIDELNVSSYQFNDGQGVVLNYVPTEVFEHTAKAPESFHATPNGDDEFTVTLSWTNPTATVGGHTLEAIDQMVLMRDGVVVQTFDNPTPGEAMSYVDPAGLPIQVNYTLHAVCQGYGGRKAHADGVKLGPTCPWNLLLTSSDESGWGDGMITILNASGVKVGDFAAERSETMIQTEVPLGKVTLRWTAPSSDLDIQIVIRDLEEQPVFSYSGPSNLMPEGIFFEIVNTCGAQGSYDSPSALTAQVDGDDVKLSWTGINDPGYGYIVYRDGFFHSMVTDVTTFVDANAAAGWHSYYITAFCVEGETDPSNTVCAVKTTEVNPPQNFDYEILANGKAKLTWEAPENQESLAGYRVYRKLPGESYKLVKSLGASASSFTETQNPTYGDRCYYTVVGIYDNGNLESSPAVWVRNPDLYYVEINRTIIPSGLSLEVQEGNQLLLQWDEALYAETYNLYCNGVLVADQLNETHFTDTLRGEALVYQVKGVRNEVESSPSNKACYGNVSVDETVDAAFQWYPNPTRGQVTIQAEGLQEVTVYNSAGQMVVHQKLQGSSANLDLSGHPTGVYFLRVRTGQTTNVQRIILMH